jgi:hypothetical protein
VANKKDGFADAIAGVKYVAAPAAHPTARDKSGYPRLPRGWFARVEVGWSNPRQRCIHRHRTMDGAFRCGDKARARLGNRAVVVVVIDAMNTVVHGQFWDGEDCAAYPFNPSFKARG